MDINFDLLGFTQQEYERNRARLMDDMSRELVEPFSFETFQKTDEEKTQLANAKKDWRKSMQQAGLSKRGRRINAIG